MANGDKNILEFLENHPVFTLEELRDYLGYKNGGRKAYDTILYQKKVQRIGVVKEGLYFSIRPGSSTQQTSPDPFLLASKLSDDAMIAFHSALDLLGFGHSLFSTFYYLTNRFRPAFRFRGSHFRSVVTPEKLRKKSQQSFGTEKVERVGLKVTVTGKERTLVDCLDRPQYCGGFEEMYRSLEKMPYLQFEVLMKYLELREQKKLYATVGFFLEQHRETFHVQESLLQNLERNKPATAVYWDRSKKGGKYFKRWNLVVPEAVVERSWEEL
jgi:predicted transcriptional regulator of viral defense system